MKQILRWQYTTLAKELRLLQGHLVDPSCPCKTEGEACVFKHLNTVEGLAIESAAMEPDTHVKELLNKLASEAKAHREFEANLTCHPFSTDKTGRVGAEWARTWAKAFEQLVLNACDLPGKEERPVETAPSTTAKKIECRGCSCHRGRQTLVVFTLAGCPHCADYKKKLSAAGIKFEEVDCSKSGNVAQCDRLRIKLTPTPAWKCGADQWEVIPFETPVTNLRSYDVYIRSRESAAPLKRDAHRAPPVLRGTHPLSQDSGPIE